MQIEPAQVPIDILSPNVESAARQILTQSPCRWVDLGLKECADAARSTVPPQKAGYLNIPFPCRSGKANERSASKACGVHCPISPGAHIVGSDNIVIDPMNRTFRFDVRHE
jgi:hypothetical protein